MGITAPVVIRGGISGGVFTATEAAVVTVACGLFAGLVVFRNLGWRDLYEITRGSAVATSEVSRWALPFVLALIWTLRLPPYVPILSLWLPDLLHVP